METTIAIPVQVVECPKCQKPKFFAADKNLEKDEPFTNCVNTHTIYLKTYANGKVREHEDGIPKEIRCDNRYNTRDSRLMVLRSMNAQEQHDSDAAVAAIYAESVEVIDVV